MRREMALNLGDVLVHREWVKRAGHGVSYHGSYQLSAHRQGHPRGNVAAGLRTHPRNLIRLTPAEGARI